VRTTRRIEIRQEVTTVEIYGNWRPSALPAACAQVSGVPALPAAAVAAHVALVGVAAVREVQSIGTSQIQAQRVRNYGVKLPMFEGLAVQGSAKVKPTDGDVRGVPPRGRPV
jgi:hypothetical protein